MDTIPMSQKNIKRFDVLSRLLRKEMNGTRAADLLNVSVRHIRRLKGSVEHGGAKALIHGNTSKQSNRRIPEKEHSKIISLLHKHYADFKPTFASEKLAECYNNNSGCPHFCTHQTVITKIYERRI